MAAMNVNNLFVNVFKDTLLGYVRVIQIGEGGNASERTCETLTSSEISILLNKEAKAWYKIGEYWYVVV